MLKLSWVVGATLALATFVNGQEPTLSPTQSPTTSAPTTSPTTSSPTTSPTTSSPTSTPTSSPTQAPTTSSPTESPTTSSPTVSPTTSSPTESPTTSAPTTSPTTTSPTQSPTASPTTTAPTTSPTVSPTESPTTSSPTESPTTTAPTESPTTSSPTTSPTASPTTVISGVGCRAHRHCAPDSWCRNDTLCIRCQIPGTVSDLCTPEFSATGVCPGKCGTVPPTAATVAPTPSPPGICRAHRECATNAFCNSTRQCEFCTLCVDNVNRSLSTSFNGRCPFKCLSIILQNQPTPPTDAPTAAPTQLPTSGAPVPAPVVPDCRNHRNCPLTHFCAGPIGNCLPCTNCTAGTSGNSINGNCPAKCVTRSPNAPTSNGCDKHFHCSQTNFCHTSLQCVPCINFVIGGASAANCSGSASVTSVCPSKCLQVLTPSSVLAGGASSSSSTATGSSATTSAGVAGTVAVVAVVVVVSVGVMLQRRRRSGATDLAPADVPISVSAPTLEKMEWDEMN
eukprot:m.33973 g.33973  ORF g.33973 m.33973 type:complete len:508 (+) comp7270_c0_seq1:334-1857(+)